MSDTTRLNKFLASAGIASRRGAEVLIAEGRVSVNGRVADTPALGINASDSVTVDGVVVAMQVTPRLWLYHKPVGVICSDVDPQGRPTIFDALPASLGRVMSVGRLDLNSEGLLLLTNNGELSRYLEHPDNYFARTYKVRLWGKPTNAVIKEIERGVVVDGVQYQGATVRIRSQHDSSNCWLTMTLHEGKNREIRRIFQHFGYAVNRLIRLSYGEFKLGDLPAGQVIEADSAVVTALHHMALEKK
jgi:23S rRNA pseudouridine2605 synthase